MTKKRLEKALIAALTFGAGSAVGGCILPRCVLPGASEETKVFAFLCGFPGDAG